MCKNYKCIYGLKCVKNAMRSPNSAEQDILPPCISSPPMVKQHLLSIYVVTSLLQLCPLGNVSKEQVVVVVKL